MGPNDDDDRQYLGVYYYCLRPDPENELILKYGPLILHGMIILGSLALLLKSV